MLVASTLSRVPHNCVLDATTAKEVWDTVLRPARVHLPGRGWAACEFSKKITSILSGSIGRQARWSESQQFSSERVEATWSARRNWWPALDARLFHRSSPTKYYETWLVANC